MNQKFLLLFIVFFAVVLTSSLYLFDQKPQMPVVDDLRVQDDVDQTQKAKKVTQHWSQKKQRVKGILPKDSPDEFMKFHHEIRTLPGEDGPRYAHNYQIEELLKARKVKSTKELSLLKSSRQLNWQERGPGNVAGRTRGILIDPNDIDTWYAGSVGGGIWKTEDAGQTWTHLTEDLTNLATSALAWSPANLNRIYAGTGEGFGNIDGIDGSGIWHSDDGGTSWTQLVSTTDNPDFENVTRLAVDPADPDVVLASVVPGFRRSGTNSGIYRSTDGGATWTKTYETSSFVEDLRANPENFNTLYATVNGVAVVKSLDGGQTWFDSGEGVAGVARMELAIAPSDTATIYVAGQGGASGSTLFRSLDAGATWFAHTDTSGNVDWLGGQGWYDNTIAVNPYDASEVFVGGVNLMKLNVSEDVADTTSTATVDEENTGSFLNLVNFGGRWGRGGIDSGENFHGLATGVTDDDRFSVEIRFGPGKTQKGHRFIFASGFQYPFQDYVDVPFEVWDIENNRQLMVSWRDHENNGVFEFEDRTTDETGGPDREYIFVHDVDYDDTNPDANIAVTAGQAFRNIFAIWPEAPAGTGVIDVSLAPESTLRINWESFVTKQLATTVITDAYAQFIGGLDKGVHVDHHNLILVKTDEETESFRLYNGNDGGMAYSDDGGNTFTQTGLWENPFVGVRVEGLKGYNTSQFYGVDKANGVDLYIGGTQDNGSFFSPADPDETSSWTDAPSGDGFEAVWNYDDVNKMIESSQGGSLRRSLDGGATWDNVTPSDPVGGPFITKVDGAKQDGDFVITIGGSGVWRSDDFASTWYLATPPANSGFNGTSSLSQAVISLANPQIVWATRNHTTASPPIVSTDGGLTYATTNVYTEVGMPRNSGFDTHPLDDSTAYALFSFRGMPKILRTTDLGQTWEELSGYGTNTTSSNGFPDVAVFSLLVMPFNTDIMWAGTEIGLFESTDGGATWAYADNGLPPVAVYQMKIVNDEIVLATHGRGVWSVTMPELEGYEPPAATLPPRFTSLGGGADGAIAAELRLPSAYDSSAVLIDGEVAVSFGANEAALDSSLNFTIEFEGARDTVTIYVSAYKDGRQFRNAPATLEVFSLGAARAFYRSDLNEANEDFELNRMSFDTPNGFDDGALHSEHPYVQANDVGQNFLNYIAQLKFPIIVGNTGENTLLNYKDVAIVELGNPGTSCGVTEFWDFVVVEGSSDNGATWLPMIECYDASFDAVWTVQVNLPNGGTGDATMYRDHTIDLLDTFNSGDEVLIRFRLESDAFATGWGWAIDNIAVQTDPVSVETDDALPVSFALSQNYPNPFNPSTKINYAIPNTAEVTLQVFNITGQKVRDLVLGEQKTAGRYTVEWDGKDNLSRPVASGLYFYRIKAGDFKKSFKMTLLK